jgi:hypothetical protein
MKKEVKITVIRTRINLKNGEIEYSLAKPCKHCAIHLKKYQKNKKIYVRYSLGIDDKLSNYELINHITEVKLSSGWREKYRQLHDK